MPPIFTAPKCQLEITTSSGWVGNPHCITAWFVLSCEEQEVKHGGISLYLSLLGFVSPFRMSRGQPGCSTAPCQHAGNSVFRSFGLVWLLELEVCDSTLCPDTILGGIAVIPEASARHVCPSQGLLTAGMRSWFGDFTKGKTRRSPRVQGLAAMKRLLR